MEIINTIPTKEDYNPLFIYQYDDIEVLNSFGFFDENRKINQKHVSDLVKCIEEVGLDYFSEIRVDINTLCIFDGQHRVEAIKRYYKKYGKCPVFSVKYEDIPTDVAKRAKMLQNIQNVKPWNSQTIVVTQRKLGNPYVLMVEEFAKERPMLHKKNGDFAWSYITSLVLGRKCERDFCEGGIYVDERMINKAKIIYSDLEAMMKALNWVTGPYFCSFAGAWHDIRFSDDYKKCIERVGIDKICDYLEYKGFEKISGSNSIQWKSSILATLTPLFNRENAWDK